MKKAISIWLAFCLCFCVFLSAGCGQKAGSASQVIQNAEMLKTAQEKINYLINQGQSLYNSKLYQEAVNVAQYILKLDSNSQPAKDLIAKATAQLQAIAQKATGDVSNKLFGN